MNNGRIKTRTKSPPKDGLTRRGGCIGGRYSAWMERLALPTPDAVRERLWQLGIEPIVDTIERASEQEYDRPVGKEAYVTLREEDARRLLDT